MGLVGFKILMLLYLPWAVFAARLSYEVRFYGIEDPIVRRALENTSDLISLRDQPPASLNGLHYRAKADLPKLLEVLKAYAYYDAEITYQIEVGEKKLIVDLFVLSGSQFRLRSYDLFHGDCHHPLTEIERCGPICAEDLGLKMGEGAESAYIINAEMALLGELSRCGYPLAYIDKRRVIVDMGEKAVDAGACVQEGPLARFGPISFFGLKDVNARFIERKIAWKEGDVFNSDLVDETQRRLLKTDLFSTVLVSYAEELDEAGELPMKIRLSESKPRSLSLGAFYATVDGPGGTFSWINRNFLGVGDQLSVDAEGSKRWISGTMIYKRPDIFRVVDQTFSALGEASREDIHAYLAFTYRESNRIEKQIDDRRSASIGIKGEYITVHESANNGIFFLLGLPIAAKYANVDSPLDATKGYSISYIGTPYQSLREGSVHFVKQRVTLNFYFPLSTSRAVFAVHAQFGSIAGTPQENVPLPKLFLGGSEDDLRGYTYKTVSPLDKRGEPLGGRSAIFATLELRFRIMKTLGFVPFFDFGTVTENQCPQVNAKWYKSVGVGVRYYTFFGPLRFDVGFPLDPRKGIDTWGKVYASIGQSF
jgi:translocation and assembly module TamA